MKLYSNLLFLIGVNIMVYISCTPVKQATEIKEIANKQNVVRNVEAFNTAISLIQPGDTILIGNGTWKDAELKFKANGNKKNKIYIIAEEKGNVFFEGQSNVKFGGEYVHIEGLVFRNGYTASKAVISFQKDKETPCNNCRVTECVIDNYNPPKRFETDYWVEIYGKNNRFDHNYMVSKRNKGVTLAVRLKNERDRENYNRIDHNYFGYRPVLGSNGGETLRIGTSHYSLSNSNTVVEDNYFERCNGELEIISSKSCQNIFRNNTFYECQGTLTMRHGNETLVENNYFFGNRKPNTGGIRVINETQTVRNNYLEGLTGYRFRGALVIMNGVPNSPLNRYFQVIDSEISRNLVFDCDYIQLCAGSDKERSATPKNTTFKENIIYNKAKDEVFTVYDDVSGIQFKDNILSPNVVEPSYSNKRIPGFEQKTLEITLHNKLKTVTTYPEIGTNTTKPRPTANNTGVSWYPKQNDQIKFGTGKTIRVQPGENKLLEAMAKAASGDVLMLEPGDHHQTKSISFDKVLTIKSSDIQVLSKITFAQSPLFAMENDGSLSLENIHISGKETEEYSGNMVIRTSERSMISNYKLSVTNCKVTDLDVSHSFNFLKVYKSSFADEIAIKGTTFKNITGHVLNMDKELDDKGIYNVENVVIENCVFEDIGGSAVKLYRGGKDESTFGPLIWLSNSKFINVGHDKRNINDAAIHLHGVQYAELTNLKIVNSKKINLHLIVGDPVIKLKNISIEDSEEIVSNSKAYFSENISYK